MTSPMWRMKAACIGQDPRMFDLRDFYTPNDHDLLQKGANQYCAVCPVRAECQTEGDQRRELGTWGGIHRRTRSGHYELTVLIDGLRAPQLERRTGRPRKDVA